MPRQKLPVYSATLVVFSGARGLVPDWQFVPCPRVGQWGQIDQCQSRNQLYAQKFIIHQNSTLTHFLNIFVSFCLLRFPWFQSQLCDTKPLFGRLDLGCRLCDWQIRQRKFQHIGKDLRWTEKKRRASGWSPWKPFELNSRMVLLPWIFWWIQLDELSESWCLDFYETDSLPVASSCGIAKRWRAPLSSERHLLNSIDDSLWFCRYVLPCVTRHPWTALRIHSCSSLADCRWNPDARALGPLCCSVKDLTGTLGGTEKQVGHGSCDIQQNRSNKSCLWLYYSCWNHRMSSIRFP